MTLSFPKYLVLSLMALMFVGGAAVNEAQAQKRAPAAAILVVDFGRIATESLAGKDVKNQLTAFVNRLESRLAQLRQQLNEEQQSLAKQREIMAPEAFQARINEFRGKAQSAEREIQAQQSAGQRAREEAEARIDSAVRPIINSIMRERRANMVLRKELVIDQTGNIDVTTEVIERLNGELPQLKVALPN
ncbi:MAG: OmpH family outer membrane protein [Pseudomonadota bacterium]